MKHQFKPLLLVFPFGLLSHYLRCIVLAKHLREYFTIKFAISDKYQSFVIAEGFDTFDCETINEEEAIEKIKKFDFSWLNEGAMQKTLASQIEAIKRHEPIAVLGDAMPTLKMAAEYSGVQYLALTNGYMSKYYQEKRSLSRTHPIYPYIKRLPAFVISTLAAEGEAIAFRKIHAPFRNIRKRYNLTPVRDYMNEMEGDITLICDLPILFPQHQKPSNYIVTGPLVYSGVTREIPDINKYLDECKKTIYVSMGSTGEWKKVEFLNAEVFKNYNIITAGDKEGILNAPHIYSTAFLNTEDIFNSVDIVLCHAGNGTIYQALAHGIPLLVFPSHFEQEWNANVLEKMGFGRQLETLNESEYVILIEEWVNKRNGANFKQMQQQILHSTLTLERIAKEIALNIIPRHEYLPIN